MEIESLRLDFLTLIIHINITKAQNISEHIREGRKKNKKPEEPRLSRAAQVVMRDPGSVQPRLSLPPRSSGGFAFFSLLFSIWLFVWML